MSKRVTAFYVHPSGPPALAETLANAVKAINKSSTVRVKSWTSLSIAGQSIMSQITEAIDRASILACDLTYINFNVIFELGYAIGKLKPVWISLDVGVAKARENYNLIHPTLMPVGYSPYMNSRELATAFVESQKNRNAGAHLLGSGFSLHVPPSEDPSLLYLQSPLQTDSSVLLSDTLTQSYFAKSMLIDSVKDNPAAPLLWYAEKVRDSDAVIAHLLSDDNVDPTSHNYKCAFVCGLALAFDKQILMLAHEPYNTPLDYKHLLLTHSTAATCVNLTQKWLDSTESLLPRRRPRRPAGLQHSQLDLRGLVLGEPVAENESQKLDQYFLETAAFDASLNAQTTIQVGRRGTGKTANFYSIAMALGGDKRNHTCLIKPIGYDIDGVIRILEDNLHRSEQGYLIESLWKYLIYGELGRSVVESIQARPLYSPPSKEETNLLEFITQNAPALTASFAVRLEQAISPLLDLGKCSSPNDQRLRISEKLHESIIPRLRNLLGLTLADRHQVTILIDNLDESWVPGQHVDHFAALMLGLLRVVRDIADDFSTPDRGGRCVRLSVVVFLRSDIFYHIQRRAPEQDKLPIQRITWDDPEMLLRVLDRRLVYATGGRLSELDIWKQFFAKDVNGVPSREFITSTVIHRPRDIIYFVKEAMSDAVNRGHTLVEEDDFYSARHRYSQMAIKSVVAEDDPQRGKLKAVLVAFSRGEKVLTRTQVEGRIRLVVAEESEVPYYLELLCDVGFLGIETPAGFRYPTDEGERDLLLEVARNAAKNGGKDEVFRINDAFYDGLQIQ